MKDIIAQFKNSFMWQSLLLKIQPLYGGITVIYLWIDDSQKTQLLSPDPLWECCNTITFLNPRETEVVKGLYNSAVITAKTRTNHQCLHRGKKEEINTLWIFTVRTEKKKRKKIWNSVTKMPYCVLAPLNFFQCLKGDIKFA